MIEEEGAFVSEKDVDWIDRSRTLIVTSRGLTSSQSRFVIDIFNLLPHSKKSQKLEKGQTRSQICDLCELHQCRNFIYFESKKRGVNFSMWIGSYPDGPSMKFQLENIVSSSDLKLQGNALKSSRHILSFDKTFTVDPIWKAAQQLISNAFNVPLYHPKSKSVIDHVLSFTVDPTASTPTCYFKNYQIFQQTVNKIETSSQLYEIGPRFVLNPILILEGVFCGDVLFRDRIVLSYSKKNTKSHREYRHPRDQDQGEKKGDFSEEEFSDDDE